jgi:hypothetical protein
VKLRVVASTDELFYDKRCCESILVFMRFTDGFGREGTKEPVLGVSAVD